MNTGPTTPTAGPDTAGNIYRLTDRLRVDVHRPSDDDGEWVDAIEAQVTPAGPAHAWEIRELVAQLFREKALWVHTLDSMSYPGGLFGWRSDTSPTGWWSGHVIRIDYVELRTLVENILPGEVRPAKLIRPGHFRPH